MDDEQDPSLQAPQEANTTKHINFAELEDTGDDTSNNSSNNDDDDDDSQQKKHGRSYVKMSRKIKSKMNR
jgi:hypothetical protein